MQAMDEIDRGIGHEIDTSEIDRGIGHAREAPY